MSIPCPNKSFKSDLNQEKTDWELLIEKVGSEDAATAEFILNGFDIPSIEQINALSPSETLDTTPESNTPIIQEPLFFPTKNVTDFKDRINQADLPEEAKESIDVILELNLEEGSFKDTPDVVSEVYQKLLPIMPIEYLTISDPIEIAGIMLQELTIRHPMRSLQEPQVYTPTIEEIKAEGEDIQDYMNRHSTFYSTTPLDTASKTNSLALNNIISTLMQDMGVEILKQSKSGDQFRIKEILNSAESVPYLRPGMEQKIYAFIRFISNSNGPTTSIVLNDNFQTSHLYEEAGHLLVFYTKNITDALGSLNTLGIERLWEIPKNGQTDYLAQTDEYKAEFGQVYQKELARITSYTNWLKDMQQSMTVDPERLGIPTIDGQPDTTSAKYIEILNTLDLPTNKNYLGVDWYEIIPGTGKSRAEIEAITYARMEIAGRILGKALLESARNKNFEANILDKGLRTFLSNLFRSFEKLVRKVIAALTGRHKEFLRKLNKSNFTDPYLKVMMDLSDQFMDDATRKNVWEKPLIHPLTATGTNTTFTENIYLENISLDQKNQLDLLIQQIPEFQQKQIDEIEKELLKIRQSPLVGDRELAIDQAYIPNQFMRIGGVDIKIPHQIWVWFYTQDPQKLADIYKNAEDQAKLFVDGKTYSNPQAKLADYHAKINEIANKAVMSELALVEDVTSSIPYNLLYNDFRAHLVTSITNLKVSSDKKAELMRELNLGNLKLFNLPGQQLFYDNHQKPYNKYVDTQTEAHLLEIKLQKIVNDINNNNKESVIRWYLLGAKVPFKGGIVTFPPLFTELFSFKNNLNIKEESIHKMKLLWEEASDNFGPNSNEADYALDNLRDARFSTEDYIFYKGKSNYFKQIYDAIKIKGVRDLFVFPADRDKYDLFIEEGKASIERIDSILSNHQTDYLAELVFNIIEREKGGVLLTEKEYLEAITLAKEIPTDMSWAASIISTTHYNNDPLYSKIMADIIRKNQIIKIESKERFRRLEEIFLRVQNKLESIPLISKYINKGATKKLNEIFHEIDRDGKRSHYFRNKYQTSDYEKDKDFDLQNIYKDINKSLEAKGYVLQIPLGDTAYEINRRNELLNWSNPLNPYMSEELDFLRKEYVNLKRIHDLTWEETRPDFQDIIDKKEKELDPFQFAAWKKKTHKKYLKFIPDPNDPNNTIIEEVPYYAGELVQPATRTSPKTIYFTDFASKKGKNTKITLDKIDYINKDFEAMYAIPEFKELYDEVAAIQEDAYELYRDKNYNYNYIKSKQSWSFTGDSVDRMNRLASGNKTSFFKRVMGEIREIFKIAEEEKEWRATGDRLRVPGRQQYDDPTLLADNYLSLLQKGWESAKNYNSKKKSEYEMETIRSILMAREYGEIDAYTSVLNKEGENGMSNEIVKKHVVQTKKSETLNNALKFIDGKINDAFYGERTTLPKTTAWRKIALFTSISLRNLKSVVVYETIAGNPFSAAAALIQASFGAAKLVAGGLYTNISNKKNTTGRLKDVLSMWQEELKGQKEEYWTGQFKTKNTLISEELGLLESSRIESINNRHLGKAFADFVGYGYMKFANNVPARLMTRASLEGLKWIDSASRFMTPDSYHSYLQSESILNLYIDDTKDPLNGNIVKGTRTLFSEIGDDQKVWNMFEVVKNPKGFNELKIVPGNEHKINNYTKAMFAEHVRSLHNFIDMKIGENPLIYQNPIIRAMGTLKNYIAVQFTDLFVTYYDEHKRNLHEAKIKVAWDMLWSITKMLSYNKENRKNGGHYRQSKMNYQQRDTKAVLIGTGVSMAFFHYISASVTYLAVKMCFDNNEPRLLCRPFLWVDIMLKRTIAEIGSTFDPIKLMQNFDKPFPVVDYNIQMLEVMLGNAATLPFFIYNLFQNDQDESNMVEKSKGPYKGMNRYEESLVRYLPFVKGIHRAWNIDALVQNDQYLTKQLKFSVTTALAISPIPIGLGAIGLGAIGSPYMVNHFLMKNVYKNDKLYNPELHNALVHPIYYPVRKTPIEE